MWLLCDVTLDACRGIATGIYTTNSPEACLFNATDSRANVIVVEDDKQLQKILQIRDQLPLLKAVVQYIGKPTQKYDNVYSWDEFMSLARHVPDSILADRHKLIAPNRCCTIIYTSGTTGSFLRIELHWNFASRRALDRAKL